MDFEKALDKSIEENEKLKAEIERLTEFAIEILGDVSVQEFDGIVNRTLKFADLKFENKRLRDSLVMKYSAFDAINTFLDTDFPNMTATQWAITTNNLKNLLAVDIDQIERAMKVK